MTKPMIEKKEWSEFRETGLLLVVNQLLLLFGYALCFEYEDGKLVNVYPARVRFRGFDNKSTEDAYRKVSRYILANAKELNEEAEEETPEEGA